jgi:hypothetical protein
LGYGKYYSLNTIDDTLADTAVVSECPAARRFSSYMQQQLRLARQCLQDAKQRQRANQQKGLQDSAFQVGEYVWLSTINIRRRFTGTPKLMPRFVGPFKVLKLVGETSYQLDLGETRKRMHDVFHSSLLKNHKGPVPTKIQPIILDEDDAKPGSLPRYEVEQILKHRLTHRSRRKADGSRTVKTVDGIEYLIRWKGFDDLHDTWEPARNVDQAKRLLHEYWQKWVVMHPGETPPVPLEGSV